MDKPFSVGGPTYLVVNAAQQVISQAGQQYLVSNLAAVGTPQYLAWGLANTVAVTAPTSTVPQGNTIGLLGGTSRVITLPGGPWYFIASAATGFLITPGDGT